MQQESPIAINAGIKTEASSVATNDALRTAVWQRINTALYCHVEPSLLLVGPDRARDEKFMDANLNTNGADAIVSGEGTPGGAGSEVAALRAAIAEARAAQQAAEERTMRATSRAMPLPTVTPLPRR